MSPVKITLKSAIHNPTVTETRKALQWAFNQMLREQVGPLGVTYIQLGYRRLTLNAADRNMNLILIASKLSNTHHRVLADRRVPPNDPQ